MQNLMRQILRDDTGATAVEYGLILSLIVLAMLSALSSFADANTTMWNKVDTTMAAATA